MMMFSVVEYSRTDVQETRKVLIPTMFQLLPFEENFQTLDMNSLKLSACSDSDPDSSVSGRCVSLCSEVREESARLAGMYSDMNGCVLVVGE